MKVSMNLFCRAGSGYGFSSSGIICALGFYFDRWRNQVLSGAFLTVGVAMFCSAPVGLFLIKTFGLSQAFLLLAGLQLQMLVVGVICKPSIVECELLAQKKIVRKQKTDKVWKSYIDFTLLANKSFLCFLLSTGSWNFALLAANVHLPSYVRVLGGNDTDISLIMTIWSVGNISGRLLGLFTVGKFSNKLIHVHSAVLVITGLATGLFIVYSKLPGGFYFFTAQIGLFTGWPNSMMTPLSLSFVGPSKLSEAYGLAYLFCGIGVVLGPAVTGTNIIYVKGCIRDVHLVLTL